MEIPTASSVPPKLLDQVRAKIRLNHYSLRTEDAYVDWAKRFILFHAKRHLREMGVAEVERFLTYLATERHVSASTQNQAKSALLFLYREVLGIELPWLDEVVQAKSPKRLPVVLTPREVRRHHIYEASSVRLKIEQDQLAGGWRRFGLGPDRLQGA